MFHEPGLYSKFFVSLPARRFNRILVRLHMTAGREPLAGVDMADQEAASVPKVHDGDVGDKVTIRSSRLRSSVDVIRALQPTKDLELVLRLQIVAGRDLRHHVMNDANR